MLRTVKVSGCIDIKYIKIIFFIGVNIYIYIYIKLYLKYSNVQGKGPKVVL
jgi:hypothetical protein